MLDLVDELPAAGASGTTAAGGARRSGLMTVSGPRCARTGTRSPGLAGGVADDPLCTAGSFMSGQRERTIPATGSAESGKMHQRKSLSIVSPNFPECHDAASRPSPVTLVDSQACRLAIQQHYFPLIAACERSSMAVRWRSSLSIRVWE